VNSVECYWINVPLSGQDDGQSGASHSPVSEEGVEVDVLRGRRWPNIRRKEELTDRIHSNITSGVRDRGGEGVLLR